MLSKPATSLHPIMVCLLAILLASMLFFTTPLQPSPKYGQFALESIPLLFWMGLMFQSHHTQHHKWTYLLLMSGSALSFLGALLDCLDELLNLNHLAAPEDIIQSTGLLVAGAGLISLLKQQARQNRLLQKLAGTDPLTGVLNRRALQLPQSATDSVFVLMDVDHFKKVNDTFGHPAGDFILVELAKLISSQIRQNDQIFRWGGEEFLLELKGVQVAEASKRIDTLRSLIDDSHFNFEGEIIKITISAGIAPVSTIQGGIKQAIKAADDALYRAKGSGRNKVVIA
ncbi:GGDEF domain-containing protein [Shewanella sp.]|uniref:GGDEF domain-containing protein n=1 Tax=Shewanella sp. TaxID=50422 RepID=UPI003564AF5B